MVRSGGGSIVTTGSSASVMGIPGCDAYTATEGATVALTRSMAVECGKQRVRVNCICPAGIVTEMVKASSLEDPSFDAAYVCRRSPLGQLGEPEEVAGLAVFLASEESSHITGGITVTPIG